MGKKYEIRKVLNTEIADTKTNLKKMNLKYRLRRSKRKRLI